MAASWEDADGIGYCTLRQGWLRQHRMGMSGGGGTLGRDGGCSVWARGGGGSGGVALAARNMEHGHVPRFGNVFPGTSMFLQEYLCSHVIK